MASPIPREEAATVDENVLLGAYVFLLAVFLGVVLISRVPSTLHTPLMSATNAIHGIVLLGAMLVLGEADNWWLRLIGFVAVVLGAGNVFGGFVVTDRMLEMFRRKPGAHAPAAAKK
jgi:NAD(P) transhydrogenase subunit alpha